MYLYLLYESCIHLYTYTYILIIVVKLQCPKVTSCLKKLRTSIKGHLYLHSLECLCKVDIYLYLYRWKMQNKCIICIYMYTCINMHIYVYGYTHIYIHTLYLLYFYKRITRHSLDWCLFISTLPNASSLISCSPKPYPEKQLTQPQTFPLSSWITVGLTAA